jgi:hypothetical protein
LHFLQFRFVVLRRCEANRVIRQAISCDLCGTEKRQTNHWFVAYEAGGELRMCGWHSRHRLRADSKHLCGQTCLHKLVDDFMARAIVAPAKRNVEESENIPQARDTSLTSDAAHFESSARLIPPATQAPTPNGAQLGAQHGARPQPELVPALQQPEDFAPVATTVRSASRSLRAEAWERERKRELLTMENRPRTTARQASSV